MIILLHSLAAMARNKSVGKDGIPAEALKNLDFHSKLLVLQVFEKRLNCEDGYSEIVDDWSKLVAQFIPKAQAKLQQADAWRAILIGSTMQKWYLSSLLHFARDLLEPIPSYIMGFRRGYQTAMLVEPLRIAMMLAQEWRLPIAVATTDADSAFESLPHASLMAGY